MSNYDIYIKFNLYMKLFDTFGSEFPDQDFVALFSNNGQQAFLPVGLILGLILQFIEGFSDRQAVFADPAKRAARLERVTHGLWDGQVGEVISACRSLTPTCPKAEQTANHFANSINFFIDLKYAGYINGTLQRTIIYNKYPFSLVNRIRGDTGCIN